MEKTFVSLKSPSAKQPAGFTLIELLVVIAIIAILAALLLPALARAKEQGEKTTCTGNLKQMGATMRMYCDDSRDYMAFCNWDGGTGTQPGGGWLYSLPNTLGSATFGTIPDPFLVPWKTSPQSAWSSGVWFFYMHNPKSYLCPVDIRSPDYAAEPDALNGGTGRNDKLSSYVMNGAVCGFNETVNNGGSVPNPTAPYSYTVCKSTQIWSPLCYLLWEPDENVVAPGNPGAHEFNDGANYPSAPPEGIGRLHSKNGGNILAMDGHVDYMSTNIFFKLANNAGSGPGNPRRGLLWWSPWGPDGH